MFGASTNIFDEAVARFFGPLAERIKLPLRKLNDGIYEIEGKVFAMRIRRGFGHSRDFLITLSEKSSTPLLPEESDQEIGLSVILEFYGKNLATPELHTAEGYLRGFEEAAKAAGEFCEPYLLDHRSNFGEIRAFVKHKIEESGARAKKPRFLPNVREEWID